MFYPIEPILIEPTEIEPGWLETGRAHYRIYHGLDNAENVDYSTLLALAPKDGLPIPLVLPVSPGERHFLAARAVSHAGMEEQNTHVVCTVEVDDAGQLLPPPPAAVSDVTAHLQSSGLMTVGFSYRPPPGYAPAERFEVLSDRGTGVLDLANPIATVPARLGPPNLAGVSQDYEAAVPVDVLPALLAVRACANGRISPLSTPVAVTAPQTDPPAVLP